VTRTNADFLIFCDSSFDPKYKTGVGGVLSLSSDNLSFQVPISDLTVKTKLFTNATNTRLELITVLWALNIVKRNCPTKKSDRFYHFKTIIYTDCKTVSDLPSRRNKLQKVGFKSQRTGKSLSNPDLYQKLYLLFDEIRPEIKWVKGHFPSQYHNVIQNLFSLVDKTTRARLRKLKASVNFAS